MTQELANEFRNKEGTSRDGRTREPTSLQHIVVPVDFSDRSNGAVTFVAEMVRKQDAKVTLIAAAHLPDMEFQETSTIDPQPIFDGLKSQLDRAYLSYFAGLNVDRYLAQRSNRRSQNPDSEAVLQDCIIKWEESVAHSILARSTLTPLKAVYICANHPVPLIFRLHPGGGPYNSECATTRTLSHKTASALPCCGCRVRVLLSAARKGKQTFWVEYLGRAHATNGILRPGFGTADALWFVSFRR